MNQRGRTYYWLCAPSAEVLSAFRSREPPGEGALAGAVVFPALACIPLMQPMGKRIIVARIAEKVASVLQQALQGAPSQPDAWQDPQALGNLMLRVKCCASAS